MAMRTSPGPGEATGATSSIDIRPFSCRTSARMSPPLWALLGPGRSYAGRHRCHGADRGPGQGRGPSGAEQIALSHRLLRFSCNLRGHHSAILLSSPTIGYTQCARHGDIDIVSVVRDRPSLPIRNPSAFSHRELSGSCLPGGTEKELAGM